MATAMITYTPWPVRGLTLDGAHYLYLSNSAFNVGYADFGLHVVAKIDEDTPDENIYLCGKGPVGAALANARGYHLYAVKTGRKFRLELNDGQATALSLETPEYAWNFWEDFLVSMDVDRDGQVQFYVYGLAVAASSVTGYQGSLDNSEPFRVGGESATANRIKGVLSLVRVDVGRSLPATWHSDSWDRIRYGLPRRASDFLAVWPFDDSLTDLSASAYVLGWGGGGTPSYETGFPTTVAPINVEMTRDFAPGHDVSFLPSETVPERAEDGTMRWDDEWEPKNSWTGTFKGVTRTQMELMRAIYASRIEFDFYEDREFDLSFPGVMVAPPRITSSEGFVDGRHAWDVSIELQEI